MTDKHSIRLIVNGREYMVDVQPSWTLAYVLREKLGLTGTKIACANGDCGSCTVIMGGIAILSCLKLAVAVEGKNIITIEGLADGDRLHPIQVSFIENGGFQCGYCTPGMIMASKALLDGEVNPTKQEVREAIGGHICRCGSYPRIVKSILNAAEIMGEEQK
jgi:carbon-monoxide dehydrogenase small subunit